MSDRVPIDYFECTCHFTIPGQSGDVVVSLGFAGADALSPPDYPTVNDLLGGLQGNISEECILTRITYNLGSADDDNPVHEETVSYPGLASGVILSPASCVLVQKRTSRGGRAYRGRAFWPGVERNGVGADGIIAHATVVGMQTNWDDMFDGMIAAGYPNALMHQPRKGPPPVPAESPTFINAYTVQPLIATQRTRMRD
jgi:hypothetical protein